MLKGILPIAATLSGLVALLRQRESFIMLSAYNYHDLSSLGTTIPVPSETARGAPSQSPAQQEQRQDQSTSTGRAEKLFWLDILEEAGVQSINFMSFDSLPTRQQMNNLYGDKTNILGLETCKVFRDSVPPEERLLGIAGLFNTNTNHIHRLLHINCQMPTKKKKNSAGIMWQVPWEKHVPVRDRLNHTKADMTGVAVENVLPVVMIRDPLFWMHSACKHPYTARINRRKKLCPKLVPYPNNRNATGNEVTVKYSHTEDKYTSLAHMWQEWNHEYYKADFPRLMVRFEDVIFRTKETVTQICSCVGGRLRDGNFMYLLEATKDGEQQNPTNWQSAVIKYANESRRFMGIKQEDLEYASRVIDPTFLERLAYKSILKTTT